MHNIKNYSIHKLINIILGNNIKFTSDCMLFPKPGISGKVIKYRLRTDNEIVFSVKTKSGKIYDVGTNTSNLQFEIINKDGK